MTGCTSDWGLVFGTRKWGIDKNVQILSPSVSPRGRGSIHQVGIAVDKLQGAVWVNLSPWG
jgi:hypothetical protein